MAYFWYGDLGVCVCVQLLLLVVVLLLLLMQQSLVTHAPLLNMCTISVVDYMAHDGKKSRSLGMVGGTIFLDHVTLMLFNYYQVTFTAAETVEAKQGYKRQLEQYDCKVKYYHVDNSIFESEEF
jgi:hypothetical protein